MPKVEPRTAQRNDFLEDKIQEKIITKELYKKIKDLRTGDVLDEKGFSGEDHAANCYS